MSAVPVPNGLSETKSVYRFSETDAQEATYGGRELLSVITAPCMCLHRAIQASPQLCTLLHKRSRRVGSLAESASGQPRGRSLVASPLDLRPRRESEIQK